MALFAGDAPIMTGDELTYDYNFDPFSAKNVQECRCGSDNCRGVLGPKPKPKDQKIVKDSIKEAVRAGVKAGKRKLKELLGDDREYDEDDEDSRSPKRRKIKEAKGVKRSTSSASMRVVKGAADSIKKSVSAQLLNARQALSSRRKGMVVKKTAKARVVKNYGKGQTKLSSRNSSLTIVCGDSSPESAKRRGPGRPRKSIANNVVRRTKGGTPGFESRASSTEGTIRVITVAGEE